MPQPNHDRYGIKCDFRLDDLEYGILEGSENLEEEVLKQALKHNVNICNILIFRLHAVKWK